ncbi:MAG: hypothetical protein ACI81L_003452 [Verrucomicrobiales bacterium]|jgi:hypothetical protein
MLVISNDVIPGFGVPVAAPGLRAAGLAEGLRANGIDVEIAVPSDVLANVFGPNTPTAPAGSTIVSPQDLPDHIVKGSFHVVLFINANLTPHLRPIDGVHFVYDMFAPKVLEALASAEQPRRWQAMATEKERALALADSVWVNGERKLGYAVGWMLRNEVDRIRTVEFKKRSLVEGDLFEHMHVVEMPVPLPIGFDIDASSAGSEANIRIGIGGYSQTWSTLSAVHMGHRALIEAGHELHALLPAHWGRGASKAPTSQLPVEAVVHDGPLLYDDFATWVQSMNAMVDVFEPSPERRFAMITRTAVALRLGVPVIHAVDSEVADLIRNHDAGWVIQPNDLDAWKLVTSEIADPVVLARKRAGARLVSLEHFAPVAALRGAAASLLELEAKGWA